MSNVRTKTLQANVIMWRCASQSTDLSPILLLNEPVLLGLLDALEDGLHELVLQPLDVLAAQRRKLHVLVQAEV